MTIWCNIHQRNYERCKNREGGILLPCRTVDLTDILEIEEMDYKLLLEKYMQRVFDRAGTTFIADGEGLHYFFRFDETKELERISKLCS